MYRPQMNVLSIAITAMALFAALPASAQTLTITPPAGVIVAEGAPAFDLTWNVTNNGDVPLYLDQANAMIFPLGIDFTDTVTFSGNGALGVVGNPPAVIAAHATAPYTFSFQPTPLDQPGDPDFDFDSGDNTATFDIAMSSVQPTDTDTVVTVAQPTAQQIENLFVPNSDQSATSPDVNIRVADTPEPGVLGLMFGMTVPCCIFLRAHHKNWLSKRR